MLFFLITFIRHTRLKWYRGKNMLIEEKMCPAELSIPILSLAWTLNEPAWVKAHSLLENNIIKHGLTMHNMEPRLGWNKDQPKLKNSIYKIFQTPTHLKIEMVHIRWDEVLTTMRISIWMIYNRFQFLSVLLLFSKFRGGKRGWLMGTISTSEAYCLEKALT